MFPAGVSIILPSEKAAHSSFTFSPPLKTPSTPTTAQAHHTFPAICFVHYPAIADIITDECQKRGIPYARYDSLPTILRRFVGYMRDVGSAGEVPLAETGDVEAAAARAAALARL